MIQGSDIICLSNDWDGDPLSKKRIALRLARKNRAQKRERTLAVGWAARLDATIELRLPLDSIEAT